MAAERGRLTGAIGWAAIAAVVSVSAYAAVMGDGSMLSWIVAQYRGITNRVQPAASMPAAESAFCEIVSSSATTYKELLLQWDHEQNGLVRDEIARRMDEVEKDRNARLAQINFAEAGHITGWVVTLTHIDETHFLGDSLVLKGTFPCIQLRPTLEAFPDVTPEREAFLRAKKVREQILVDGSFGPQGPRGSAEKSLTQTYSMTEPSFYLKVDKLCDIPPASCIAETEIPSRETTANLSPKNDKDESRLAPGEPSYSDKAAAPLAPSPAPAPSQAVSTDAAAEAWAAAKETTSVSVLDAFIAKFGNSFYAIDARARLAELKKQKETKVTNVAPQQSAEAKAANISYVIQVGSKQSQAEVLATFADMQQKYPSLLGRYRPLVQRADLGSRGVWYRLRIGPINDKSAAINLCSQLRSQGLPDCLVMANQ